MRTLEDLLESLDLDLENSIFVFFDEPSLHFKCTTLKNDVIEVFSSGRFFSRQVPFRASGYLITREDVLPLTEEGINTYMRKILMQKYQKRLIIATEASMTFPHVKKHPRSPLSES